jgi:hypothetical protein
MLTADTFCTKLTAKRASTRAIPLLLHSVLPLAFINPSHVL